MNASVCQHAFELFHHCLSLPGEERTAALESARQNDPALWHEVSSLLDAHESATADFLETPAVTCLKKFVDRILHRPNLAAGDQIKDYRIIRVLGTGSIATVYLAEQLSLGRLVALKVADLLGDEARTMASLEHPHIAQVHLVEPLPDQNAVLICMQYVPGLTLADLLLRLGLVDQWDGCTVLELLDQANPDHLLFSPKAAKERDHFATFDQEQVVLYFASSIGKALDYAHTRGVLHLDIKPSNILVDRYGRPWLVDFNVSMSLSVLKQSEAGILGGTMSYMPPEQRAAFLGSAESSAIDARADIYALGRLLADCLVRLAAPSLFLKNLVAYCTEAAAEQRPRNAAFVCELIESDKYLHDVTKDARLEWQLTRFGRRWPGAFVVLVVMIPNAIASLVQITYNKIHIVSDLGPSGQEVFHRMLMPWNLAVFSLTTLFVMAKFRHLFRFLFGFKLPAYFDYESKARLRQSATALIRWVGATIIFGWSMGCVLFIAGLSFVDGFLAERMIGHFVISFALSAGIALTYSLAGLRHAVLSIIYPRLLEGTPNCRQAITAELRSVTALSMLRFLGGAVPLCGAALVVVLGPERFDRGADHSYQVLMLALLALGMIGFWLAGRLVDETSRSLFALRNGRVGGHG